MECGTRPSGWFRGSRGEAWDIGAGAAALRGCCNTLTSSSTSNADAIAAIPGRVTVHC